MKKWILAAMFLLLAAQPAAAKVVTAKATRAEACRRVESERRVECVEPRRPDGGRKPEGGERGGVTEGRDAGRLGWSAARRGNSTRSALCRRFQESFNTSKKNATKKRNYKIYYREMVSQKTKKKKSEKKEKQSWK